MSKHTMSEVEAILREMYAAARCPIHWIILRPEQRKQFEWLKAQLTMNVRRDFLATLHTRAVLMRAWNTQQ